MSADAARPPVLRPKPSPPKPSPELRPEPETAPERETLLRRVFRCLRTGMKRRPEMDVTDQTPRLRLKHPVPRPVPADSDPAPVVMAQITGAFETAVPGSRGGRFLRQFFMLLLLVLLFGFLLLLHVVEIKNPHVEVWLQARQVLAGIETGKPAAAWRSSVQTTGRHLVQAHAPREVLAGFTAVLTLGYFADNQWFEARRTRRHLADTYADTEFYPLVQDHLLYEPCPDCSPEQASCSSCRNQRKQLSHDQVQAQVHEVVKRLRPEIEQHLTPQAFRQQRWHDWQKRVRRFFVRHPEQGRG